MLGSVAVRVCTVIKVLLVGITLFCGSSSFADSKYFAGWYILQIYFITVVLFYTKSLFHYFQGDSGFILSTRRLFMTIASSMWWGLMFVYEFDPIIYFL